MNEIITKTDKGAVLAPEVAQKIADLEKKAKEIKEAQNEMKNALLEAMEKYGVKKIDNDLFTVTYVAEHDAEKFDSKAFKEENPDIYDSYVKLSPASPSVRIKLK